MYNVHRYSMHINIFILLVYYSCGIFWRPTSYRMLKFGQFKKLDNDRGYMVSHSRCKQRSDKKKSDFFVPNCQDNRFGDVFDDYFQR